jgi:MFS family permease
MAREEAGKDRKNMDVAKLTVAMPRGVTNAYLFQICNAISWSLILGTPILLYLKKLGASATVLGMTVALLPLFSALQIPAASYVERMGYKLFVVRGWASRSIFILGIAVVAILPGEVGGNLRVALILVMLACFAVVRGISMCGYLPWMAQLVPETLRGIYVSRDSMCMNLAITGTMLLSSGWVALFPSSRAYSALFLLSYLSALASVVFLRRIPDAQTIRSRESSARPPWKEMFLFRPFLRYVAFTVFFNSFVAALGILWVLLMKDGCHASGSLILGLSAYASMIMAAVSLFTGPIADRVGSRPLLAFASGLVIIAQCGWMSLAAGALPPRAPVLFGIISFGATGFAIFTVASTRLLMGLVPTVGRTHFFALSNVANSLTLGVLPILWGMAIDGLGRIISIGMPLGPHWTWNRYSLVYAVIVMGLLSSQFLRSRLDEPRAMLTEEFMRIVFIQSPARVINRVLSPLRRFLPPG